MAAQPLIAAMPPAIACTDSYIVRIAALDPTTGAAVSGVTISGMTIQAVNLGGGAPTDLESGPFVLIPGPEGK